MLATKNKTERVEPADLLGELLTPEEAAERLGVTTLLLKRWRGRGVGPAYLKISRKVLRYRATSINRWLARREVTPPLEA